MRRKGERKLEREWPPYAIEPIRHMIASGTSWFSAWTMQACTPLAALSRITKIDPDRVDDIDGGAPVTPGELQAFARVWNVDPAIVVSTMPDRALLGGLGTLDN